MKKLTTNERIKQDKPLEIWKGVAPGMGDWTWKVYRKYKRSDAAEAKDPYSRWFCGVKSPYTYGSYELGDVYVKDIKSSAVRTFKEGEEETIIGDLIAEK